MAYEEQNPIIMSLVEQDWYILGIFHATRPALATHKDEATLPEFNNKNSNASHCYDHIHHVNPSFITSTVDTLPLLSLILRFSAQWLIIYSSLVLLGHSLSQRFQQVESSGRLKPRPNTLR